MELRGTFGSFTVSAQMEKLRGPASFSETVVGEDP